MSEAARGRLLILGAAVLWSFGGTAIRFARAEGIAPEAIAAVRSLTGGLVLAWALPAMRAAIGPRFWAAGLIHVGVLVTYVLAVTQSSAAHAIFLQFSYAPLVALGGWWFYREPIGGRGVVALLLAAAGVGVILAEGAVDPGGLKLGLSSALLMTTFYLVQRGVTKGSPVGLASAYLLMAGLVILPMAAGKLGGGTPAGWAAVVAAGVFQHGMPYVLFLHGLRKLSVGEGAILSLLEPVLNPMWVALFLGEVPSRTTVIGGALILGAVLTKLRFGK